MGHTLTAEAPEAAATECLKECPHCNGVSLKKLPVPGNWIGSTTFGDLLGKIGLVRCRSCQLEFANPRPSSDKLSAFYSGDTYVCHESGGSASAGSKADYLLDRITRVLPANTPRSLLDYGAGGGGFLSYARQQGWSVQGFEPGPRGLQACREAGLDVTDQLEDLPSGAFGLVTLHHVFEHLANPTEVLDGLRTLLAPEGRLFVEVPNVRSLRARIANPFFSRWFHVDERYRAFPIHLFYYSERTLSKVFQKAGWTVEKTFTVGLGLDELIVTREANTEQADQKSEARFVPRSRKRRLRHALRDGFLNLKLGENLAVIAYPNK